MILKVLFVSAHNNLKAAQSKKAWLAREKVRPRRLARDMRTSELGERGIPTIPASLLTMRTFVSGAWYPPHASRVIGAVEGIAPYYMTLELALESAEALQEELNSALGQAMAHDYQYFASGGVTVLICDQSLLNYALRVDNGPAVQNGPKGS
jgi:hypothetical protein